MMRWFPLFALPIGLSACVGLPQPDLGGGGGTFVSTQDAGTVEEPAPDQENEAAKPPFDSVPQFGGQNSVGGQLKEDDEVKETVFRFEGIQKALKPYFDWKARLVEEYGLALGLDYTGLWFGASEDLGGEDSAGSGIFRFFGTWTLVETEAGGSGSLVFKVEDRHAYSDVPVSGLGFETGTVGLLGPPFNDNGFMLTNLYWMQKFNQDRTTLVGGVVDVTDYVDIYGMINPWTAFSNLVFSTGSGTTPAPNQGLGAAFGTFMGDSVYLVAGTADTNGDPTETGDSVESFFDDNEYFSQVELGWVSSFEERYLNNAHLVAWHADERKEAGIPDGWGVNFSWAQFLDDKWMPFVRAGYADEGGALLERSVSAGVGRYTRERGDLLGLGLNWGEPSEDFGPDLPDQYTAELFYRIQLSQNFALTPDLQYVMDPALNSEVDSLFYFGVRARLSL